MRATLVLAWRGYEASAEPVLVYCGVDGAMANRAAAAARESGEFRRIGKLVNPMFIPIPAIPDRRPEPKTEGTAAAMDQAPSGTLDGSAEETGDPKTGAETNDVAASPAKEKKAAKRPSAAKSNT